jgi:hypothetical protein
VKALSFLFPFSAALCCSAVALHCQAQGTAADARPAAVSASATSAAHAARPTGKIYQQRQKDGSILFTDKPADTGAVTERSWTVPTEDPDTAEKRREQARQEAKQDAQAVNERLQRQIERQQERDEALAIERMRLNQAQAQRDAEVARADRERSERERAVPPVIVVMPGQRPRHQNTPVVGLPVTPAVRPPPSSPPATLCTAPKASDCNAGGNPGRSGFGGR